jgi:hypothetical protein
MTAALATENPRPATQLVDAIQLSEHMKSNPDTETLDDLTDEQKADCYWQLKYLDFVPVLEVTGNPTWEKLPTERQDHYLLFKLYRDQKYGMLTTGESIVLSRSLAELAADLRLNASLLSLLSSLFHWKTRTAAYDLFMEQERQLREQRFRQLIQSDHLFYARQLAQDAFERLQSHDNIQPKELLQMLELGLKYGRISVGLPGDKPEQANGNGEKTIVNVNNTQNIDVHDNSQQTSQTLNVHAASPVQQAYDQQVKSPDTIQQILNVLQRSGAVSLLQGEPPELSQELEVAEGDYDDDIDDDIGSEASDST